MRPLAVSLLVLGVVVVGGVGRWSAAWWGRGADDASASSAAPGRASAADAGGLARVQAEEPAAVVPTPAATPEQLVIEECALAQVARAIERGRWGDEDRVVLRRLLGGLRREQRAAVMRQLEMAVNEGRLQLDPIGPLL